MNSDSKPEPQAAPHSNDNLSVQNEHDQHRLHDEAIVEDFDFESEEFHGEDDDKVPELSQSLRDVFGDNNQTNVEIKQTKSELVSGSQKVVSPWNNQFKKLLPQRTLLRNFFLTVLGWIRNPYEAYVDLMYHLFDLSFGMLMVYFTILFYIQCIFCAILIYAAGLLEPECLIFDGVHLDEVTEWFNACWILSWTTFSTTGYGNTAPSLSRSDGDDIDEVEKCIAVNTLLMIVSFIGIVYAGSAGAILFSKVEKIKGEGQVSFSQACVIRFGSGLKRLGAEDDDEDDDGGEKKAKNLCPCPVLEFRILNHNHNTSQGVIINSELKCLASVEDERLTSFDPTYATDSADHGTLKFDSLQSMNAHNLPSGSRIQLPRRLFLNMELTNGEHPFFRRCWTATHVIDEKSPLISKKMRDRITRNHGFWPIKYNNVVMIKRYLRFKQIVVNFSGVSKWTSKEVQAQHVYDLQDIIVGYQFENVLEKGEEDEIIVRGERLNDITEQNGIDKGEDLMHMIYQSSRY